MFEYRNIAETISQYDLATERLDGVTFVQRRFRDAAEFENTLRLIQARGLDPAGKEAEGNTVEFSRAKNRAKQRDF